MKRIFCFIFALILIVLSLSGCRFYKSYFGNRPCDQKNTKWISEDGRISFWSDETGSGVIENGDETIEIHVGIGPATEIDIYPLENVVPYDEEIGTGFKVTGEAIEHWVGDFKYKDHFTATVKRTTYFHVGDQITFYRVDEASPSNDTN